MADIIGYKKIDDRWYELWTDGERYDITPTLLGAKLELDHQLDIVKRELFNSLPPVFRWLFKGWEGY